MQLIHSTATEHEGQQRLYIKHSKVLSLLEKRYTQQLTLNPYSEGVSSKAAPRKTWREEKGKNTFNQFKRKNEQRRKIQKKKKQKA